MEDSQKLIVELLAKLGELDSKVANYQQDMLAQFTKFSEDLLKDVPEAVSTEVSRAIAESMAKFPYLSTPPGSRDESQPPTPTEEAWRDGRKSPPPVLYHTSGVPKHIFRADGGDRSPHERDKEFRGVFTPSYLPLLENRDRPQSTPTSPAIVEPSSVPLVVPPADFLRLPDSIVAEKPESEERTVSPEGGTDKGKEKEKEKEVTQPLPVRRPPVRSMTDSSVHSISSSGSGGEAKTRRSALRRSSSSNKGSPRRVRFHFGDAEVLPSSSPDKDDFGVESPHGSSLDDEAESKDDHALSASDDSYPRVSKADNDATLLSLFDMAGIEDFGPRPKKVSSTQALRELSRSPFEEGTVWKTVNAEPDSSSGAQDISSVAATNGGSEATDASDLTPTNSSAALSGRRALAGTKNSALSHHLNESQEPLGSPLEEMERQSDDYDSSSEEEFLSMKPKSKSPSPATRSPRERSPATRLPHAEKVIEQLKPAPSLNPGQAPASVQRQAPQLEPKRRVDQDDSSRWEADVMARLRLLLKQNINCDYSVDVKNTHNTEGGPSHRNQRVITVTLPVPVGPDVQNQIQQELLKSVAPAFTNTSLKFNCPKPSRTGPAPAGEPGLFDWDEEGLLDEGAGKYLPEEDEYDEEAGDGEETETEPGADTDTEHKPSTLFSTSPAVGIPGRDKPAGPIKTKFSDGGIGSYNGRTLHVDVVKSPKVLEHAAALGDFQSFVGSVNGNSGFDPSDANSYRASLGQHVFSGTPRSLSERMMLQDKMALERGEDLEDEDFPY